MRGVSASVSVNRPAEEVSAFLADLANQPQWHPLVVSAQLSEGTAGAAGAVYDQRMALRGHEVSARAEVTAVEPRRVTFKLRGLPLPLSGEYAVVEQGAASEVTVTMDAGMMTRAVGSVLRPALEEGVEKLKKVLEAA